MGIALDGPLRGPRSGGAPAVRGTLAVVQAQAAVLGLQVADQERWLAGGFLRDGMPAPRAYLGLAARHKVLRRELLALTQRLLTEAPLRPVA